jgi:hypothetical protein
MYDKRGTLIKNFLGVLTQNWNKTKIIRAKQPHLAIINLPSWQRK